MTQRQKALLSCAVAAALLLSGCRKGNSDSGSMSSSNAMSGSSGSASTTQTGGWKTGLGILTEASDEARTGTIRVDKYRDAVAKACTNASALGAAKGDRVSLGVEAENASSDITATDDKDVNAEVDLTVVALTRMSWS